MTPLGWLGRKTSTHTLLSVVKAFFMKAYTCIMVRRLLLFFFVLLRRRTIEDDGLEDSSVYVIFAVISLVCFIVLLALCGDSQVAAGMCVAEMTPNARKRTFWTNAPSEDSDQTAHPRSPIRISAGGALDSQECKVCFMRTTVEDADQTARMHRLI